MLSFTKLCWCLPFKFWHTENHTRNSIKDPGTLNLKTEVVSNRVNDPLVQLSLDLLKLIVMERPKKVTKSSAIRCLFRLRSCSCTFRNNSMDLCCMLCQNRYVVSLIS
ncbi:hypothetical protein CEXT_788811 [Caerostris extrusa]|uniref:Uncharacterized protein n=1 Tax=Caerostris extrusa TaxID=172846 RepID=A0AAV4QTD3_CAEEX|nr:hypothetical protein CEXT_788811 [Caerostris extrusa]